MLGWQSKGALPWALCSPGLLHVLSSSGGLGSAGNSDPFFPKRKQIFIDTPWTWLKSKLSYPDPAVKYFGRLGWVEVKVHEIRRDTRVGTSQEINILCSSVWPKFQRSSLEYDISFHSSWISLDSQVFRQLPMYLWELTSSKYFRNCSKDLSVSSLEGVNASWHLLLLILLFRKYTAMLKSIDLKDLEEALCVHGLHRNLCCWV